jgi:DNA-binding transcriptional LysR family regulator
MIDIDKLKAFYLAIREGSVTAAATLLGITQPSLSQKLNSLQKELGEKLYQKTSMGITPTSSGLALLEKAKNILLEMEHLKNYIEEQKQKVTGSIRISTTHALASQWLIKAVPSIRETYNELEIVILANDYQSDLFIRGCDVSISEKHPDTKYFEQKFLKSFNIGLFASKTYLERYGCPLNIEDLRHHSLISYPEDTPPPYKNINWHLNLNPEADSRKPLLRVNSSAALQKAGELGLGIFAMSEEAISFNSTDVVRILPDLKGPKIDIYYIFPKSLIGTKKITVLYDLLFEEINKK